LTENIKVNAQKLFMNFKMLVIQRLVFETLLQIIVKKTKGSKVFIFHTIF